MILRNTVYGPGMQEYLFFSNCRRTRWYKRLLWKVEILDCNVREAKVTCMRQECFVWLYVSLESLVLYLNAFVFMYNWVWRLPFSAPFAFSCPSPFNTTHITVSIQQNPYWETNSNSVCQEFRDLFSFSIRSNSPLSVYLHVCTSICLSSYPATHPSS
jgi:hypothetical protein